MKNTITKIITMTIAEQDFFPQQFVVKHQQKSDLPAQWAKFYFGISRISNVKYEFPPK